MKYRTTIVLATSLAAMAWLALLPAMAAPQPTEARLDWQINVDYKSPQPILIQTPGMSKPELYWFFQYRVVNKTNKDIFFTPEIDLYTNTGDLVKAGRGVSPSVFQEIKKRLNVPLLRDSSGTAVKLLQGEDNALEFVAIFRDFDPKSASFDIFFGGLSGEMVIVKLPKPIEVTEVGANGKFVKVQKDSIILNKTLKLEYDFGTEAADRANATPKLVRKDWVMR